MDAKDFDNHLIPGKFYKHSQGLCYHELSDHTGTGSFTHFVRCLKVGITPGFLDKLTKHYYHLVNVGYKYDLFSAISEY